MKATSTDPLNHTTSFTYSSSFAGAYMTQTNLPDTQMPDSGAPIVHHVVSGNYDFSTGLLTSFTDENSQQFTYSYDLMLRLTQGNHPDGGQTVFTYPDPNTVTRQRLMTAGNYEGLYTAKFDGLGRSYQTQQITPSGTVLIDTTYDSVGRESTISNPYYSGSNHGTDPTYGIVTTQYDALSRAVKSTKQDGSIATVAYSDNCTTATDEAGKQRKVCSDALGRMTEVDEPNPASAATYATGWISVSGTEQTANSQPATSGSGTVTISGSEQSACNYIRNVCHLVYDTGTVTITVNSYPKTVNYGGSSETAATVAWKLSCAFHNDSSSPVDAYCPSSAGSSTSVTLTARATGASTNYSFTTSSATNDTQCIYFCGPSFSASPASGALTHGQDASSTPDTGTVTATINGTPYSVSYGAGDTSGSIATRLATAISNGSYANASPSGSTINLTSKTIGTAGDYSLSAAYTWNNSQFSNPSFTTSTSGSIAGALDASALNNNPYVTLYQYDTLNNLLCVHQKATDTTADVACAGTTPPSVPASWRQRFFTYDSFSRLLTASNPEAGKISYGYDNAGRLTSKVEPMPNQTGASTVTITYAYDNLDRLTDKTYSDATQNSSYRYDYASYLGQSFQYPIGRQVAATAANQTIKSFVTYDKMGRVNQTTECIPGVTNCQNFTASYDLLGDLTQIAYPANSFKVNYQYDSAARLLNATDSNNVVYAQSPTILASGAMQEFTSPNFNNYKFHTDLNSRLQPTEIWAGTGSGSSAVFDKQYTYNAPNTSQVNNGNIYTVTNVKDSTRTQTFAYDVLNRLASARDGTHWGNTYTYDAWGNLQKIPGSPAGENFQHAADSNNHLVSYNYDAAGNMTNDGATAYVIDAENRITSATANSATTTYTYDADGRRVKKSSGANYWYGPGGGVMAETDSSGNWTNYIFFGGQRLARNISGDIKYYVTDHLHSTAMFVDNSGSILDDNDFYPWGGLVPGVGQTTSTNHYKFTGKERDSESSLDDFGARYYSSTIGRFMSPDWAAKPTTVPYAQFGDPQSLNLYAYVRNSPIIRVDADGHNFAGYDGMNTNKDGGITEIDYDIEFEIAVTGGDYSERSYTGADNDLNQSKTSTSSTPNAAYSCSGTAAQCAQIKTGIETLQKAANNLSQGSEGRDFLENALDLLLRAGPEIKFPEDDRGWGGARTENGKTTLTISLLRTPTELAAELAHESTHGVDQRANGVPKTRMQEKFYEIRGYKAQGYVNQALGISSGYGIWTAGKGWDLRQVYKLAELSTQVWCSSGGGCK
ncbi:MAG TPA: RHS repeat-associated core domain-containing protein [Candidatus Angelobacter sp.]